jgi:hypothetical protein
MNHSIITADRTTHLKIVVVALIGATLVAGVGIAARVTESQPGATIAAVQPDIPLIKAGHPVAISRSDATVVR